MGGAGWAFSWGEQDDNASIGAIHAALDKGIARRVKTAVERFATIGAGNVKRLQDIDPPEYRLRVGDYRARFELDKEIMRILRVRHPDLERPFRTPMGPLVPILGVLSDRDRLAI